jgi:hypothetical protein
MLLGVYCLIRWNWHTVFIVVVSCIFVAILFGLLFYICVWLSAKQDVDDTPKVPMLLCDKHGLYPESAAFDLTSVALGMQDLTRKQCPFCFDERMKVAEEELKRG